MVLYHIVCPNPPCEGCQEHIPHGQLFVSQLSEAQELLAFCQKASAYTITLPRITAERLAAYLNGHIALGREWMDPSGYLMVKIKLLTGPRDQL